MRTIFRRLWLDQRGTVVTAEVVLIASILVIGLIVGAKSLRDSAITEWADFAQAIGQFDQSYNVPDVLPGDGSGFVDGLDFCDTAADQNGPVTLQGVTYGIAPTPEGP